MVFGADADLQDALREREAKNRQMRFLLSKHEDKPLNGVKEERAIQIVSLYEQFERFEYDKEFLWQDRPSSDEKD